MWNPDNNRQRERPGHTPRSFLVIGQIPIFHLLETCPAGTPQDKIGRDNKYRTLFYAVTAYSHFSQSATNLRPQTLSKMGILQFLHQLIADFTSSVLSPQAEQVEALICRLHFLQKYSIISKPFSRTNLISHIPLLKALYQTKKHIAIF